GKSGRGGCERGAGGEVERRLIDGLTWEESPHDGGGRPPQPGSLDIDARALCRLDYIAGVDFGDVIVAPDLIVDAARHDRSIEPRPAHFAPEDRHNAAHPVRRRADIDRRTNLGAEIGDVAQTRGCDVAHGALSSDSRRGSQTITPLLRWLTCAH